LRVAQPTISEQLKLLEEYLETPLFDRRPGGLRLNAQGRRVFEHTKTMFRAARRLIQEVNPNRLDEVSVLEIGVSSTVSRYLTARRFLPLFRIEGAFPRVRFGTYEDLLEDVITGEIDILLSENAPPDTHVDRVGSKALMQCPMVAVASTDLAAKVKDFPVDLGGRPFVQYTRASRYRWELDELFLESGISPDVIAEVDDVELMVAAAEQGLAVAIVPEVVATSALRAGRLVDLGNVTGMTSAVYAQYHEVTAADAVQRAVEALSRDA
jgi:DNA-binding transcriptional LysR family regulator